MLLHQLLDPSAVTLSLESPDREGVLRELCDLLGFQDGVARSVVSQLVKREALGSTGYGAGVAIPHCRVLAVRRLHLAFGRHPTGVEWHAMDGHPVRAVFLIVAPPQEVSNQYLPMLGKLATLLHDPAVPPRLASLASPDELFALFREKGV